MALISVILPCYNVAQYIDRVMVSLTQQTIGIENLEIICIDDASIDNTWTLLQVWEQRFPQSITIIHCEVNGRQGTARNIGLQYVSSSYIAFIDADDWVELDYFEKLYQPILSNDYDVVVCDYQRDFSNELSFFQNRNSEKKECSIIIDSMEKRITLFNHFTCGHPVWGKIIKRTLLEENSIFFPEQLAYEDAYFEALLHFYVQKIYLLDQKLYHYYVNNQSTVLQKDSYHHIDWLTVHIIKWQTWTERNFLTYYREELEYEFLWSCYLGFLKLLALRYNKPPYSLFLLAKNITLERIPEYHTNQYIKEGFNAFQKVVLETLRHPITQTHFDDIIDMIRKHGL